MSILYLIRDLVGYRVRESGGNGGSVAEPLHW